MITKLDVIIIFLNLFPTSLSLLASQSTHYRRKHNAAKDASLDLDRDLDGDMANRQPSSTGQKPGATPFYFSLVPFFFWEEGGRGRPAENQTKYEPGKKYKKRNQRLLKAKTWKNMFLRNLLPQNGEWEIP